MLATNYYANVIIADRKSTGQSYRRWVAQELIDTYDLPDHNVVESSRMLFDAARLVGIHSKKVNNDWKFTTLKSINTDITLSGKVNLDTKQLQENTSNKIKAFQKSLFTSFNDFETFWCKQKFVTPQDYLNAFYRYIPYVKLGIDEEPEVKNIPLNPDNSLKIALARQSAVIRRVTTVFQYNRPEGLPDIIFESLIDFAVRIGEGNIPLKALLI